MTDEVQTPEAPTTPVVEAPPAPFNVDKFLGRTPVADPTKKPVAEPEPPASPEPPAEPEPEPPVEPEPHTIPKATASDEFDFNAYSDTSAKSKAPATPVADNDVWDRVKKELGIKSTTPEDIIKEIKSREDLAIDSYRNDPVAKIDKLLAQDNTVKVTAYYMEKYGMNVEQAKKYVETVIEKKGADAVNDEAFIASAYFENKRDAMEASREAREAEQERNSLQLQSELKSTIASQKDVFTIPVEQGNNGKFEEWFFSGKFAETLSNPKNLIDTARFIFEKNTILKSVADKALEKGRTKGYEEAKAEYEKKIFNKDTKTSGSSRGEQKNTPAKKGAFDPQKFIHNVQQHTNGQPLPR